MTVTPVKKERVLLHKSDGELFVLACRFDDDKNLFMLEEGRMVDGDEWVFGVRYNKQELKEEFVDLGVL